MLLIHRLFLKTALVYLFLGALVGGWMLLAQAGAVPEGPRNLFTVHIHLLGIGFFRAKAAKAVSRRLAIRWLGQRTSC